jgi:two-component system phosphate regulon sensor histidine kinase PhoR
VIIILDVTEKEEREKLRREFSANVSHELKTPLTSISGYAEIIKNGIAKNEDIKHFASSIYDESQRLIALIEDIIKLSLLDEEASVFEKQKVNLKDVVILVAERLKQEAGKKNLSVELNLTDAEITGSRRILEEMVYNLYDNAIKYNRVNGMVAVDIEKTGGRIALAVKDTGIGIRQEDTERVFERFYRADKSHSKETPGTGLGLSIVKHGALYHGAKVYIESEPGKGTAVRIEFYDS